MTDCTVTDDAGKVRHVKNLDWLLRRARQVDWLICWANGDMTAHLRIPGTLHARQFIYRCNWADNNVRKEFVNKRWPFAVYSDWLYEPSWGAANPGQRLLAHCAIVGQKWRAVTELEQQIEALKLRAQGLLIVRVTDELNDPDLANNQVYAKLTATGMAHMPYALAKLVLGEK